MKKLLVLGGIAASMFAPAPAHAGSYQVGTPGCYVQIDTIEPNLTLACRPPFSNCIDPEGQFGAGVHCEEIP